MEAGLLLRAAGGWRPPSARAVAQRPPTLPQPVSQGPRPTWFHLFLFQAKLGSESLHRLLGQQKGCPSTQSTPDRVLLPDVPLKAVWAGRLGSPVLMQRNHWGRPRSARHPGRCGDAPGTLRPLPLTHVPPSQKPHPHHTTRAPEKRPWVPAEPQSLGGPLNLGRRAGPPAHGLLRWASVAGSRRLAAPGWLCPRVQGRQHPSTRPSMDLPRGDPSQRGRQGLGRRSDLQDSLGAPGGPCVQAGPALQSRSQSCLGPALKLEPARTPAHTLQASTLVLWACRQ